MYQEEYTKNNQIVLTDIQLQQAIAQLLMDLVEEGDIDNNNIQELSIFDSPKIPLISIYDYIGRIIKQAQCSQECLIMAVIHIDRLSQKYGRIILKSQNVHRYIYFLKFYKKKHKIKRMYVISVLISAKFYDDRFFQNVYYANVAGISHEEFNMLERKYLFLLDFKLLIDPPIFFSYRDKILTHYVDETE